MSVSHGSRSPRGSQGKPPPKLLADNGVELHEPFVQWTADRNPRREGGVHTIGGEIGQSRRLSYGLSYSAAFLISG